MFSFYNLRLLFIWPVVVIISLTGLPTQADSRIGVFVDQSSLSLGGIAPQSISVSGFSTEDRTVDIHIGLIAPDGTSYEYPDWNQVLRPWLSWVRITAGFDYPVTEVFDARDAPGGLTAGVWHATAALTEPGTTNFIDMTTVAFSVVDDPVPLISSSSVPIVYSWSERTLSTFNLKGTLITALDNYDPLPDVSFVFGDFKEANIVDRDALGREKTLFDCIGNDQIHCAALDPRVSPDNTKIAFAVVFGRGIVNKRWTIHGDLPIPVVGSTNSAQIYIYDTIMETLTAWPRTDGVFDMHPEWINNEELVFVSTRAKQYPVRMYGKSPSYGSRHALQRWKARIDGSAAENIGPHDDMALHPLVLSDGNILTATWRVDERLHWNVTPENQYWMTMTDQFGGNEVSVLGAHYAHFSQGSARNGLIALHFYGELSNGHLATSNYYRFNHLGLGMPIAFPRLPHGVEGVGGSFLPAIYSLLPWAQEEDNPTHRDAKGQFMGKGGYPVGLPGGQVMLTKGTGYCYQGLLPAQANADYLRGPGCDTGIYVLTDIPSKHPDDLVRVVDRQDRHEFSADVRLPYVQIYGRDMPGQQKRVDQGFCSLGIVDVHRSKLKGGGAACSKLGACIEPDYTVADITKLAIYEAIPNTSRQTTLKGFPREGQEMRLLGYAAPESDGSVNIRIPCDTPYKLRGVADDGTEFIRDQVKHSNRPGEARKCLGCHAGHTMSDHQPRVDSLFTNTIAGARAPKLLQLH